MNNRRKYLKVSKDKVDDGNLIGKLPSELSVDDLRELGHPEKLTKNIRAKCLDCAGGSEAEVRKCVACDCPLWPFRMGKNPFYGKKREEDSSE